MAKKLVDLYKINLTTNTISLHGNVHPQNILVITDVNTNTILYNFASPAAGYVSVEHDPIARYTDVVLTQDLADLGVTTTSPLMIYIDVGPQVIDFDETFIDPVNKLRISAPQNLIDTDFEYGLQNTKWETLELSNNIPSFFSTQSEAFLYGLVKVETTAGSDIISVTFNEPHRLTQGTPIDVTGLSTKTAEGKYLIARVNNEYVFTYKAKKTQSLTREVNGPYTSIIPGQFYTGSQVPFTSITTDAALESRLTITTPYEHGFQPGSSFYLTNTISPKSITLTNTTGTAADGRPIIDFANVLATTGTIDPTQTETKYLRGGYSRKINATNVDVAGGRILWPGHQFKNADCVLYVANSGDTEIGGLYRFDVYYVVSSAAGSFRLATSRGGSPIAFTSAGTYSYGRAQIMLVYEIKSVQKNSTSYNNNNRTQFAETGSGSGWDLADPTLTVGGLHYGLTGQKADFYIPFARSTGNQWDQFFNMNYGILGPYTIGYVLGGNASFNTGANPPATTNFIDYGDAYANSSQYFYASRTPDFNVGGGVISYTNATWDFWGSFSTSVSDNDLFILPAFKDAEHNTLFSAGSNLVQDGSVTLTKTSGSSIIIENATSANSTSTSLLSDGTYTVEAVSVDRFRLKQNGSLLNILQAAGDYSLAGDQGNLTANSIFFTNHGLSNGELVKLTVNSGGVVPTTTTGTPPLVPSTSTDTVYQVVSNALTDWTAEQTGNISIVLDGYNSQNPMQYASGTGWSGSAIYAFSLNQYTYEPQQGINDYPDWNQSLDTGFTEDLFKNRTLAGRGYYVQQTAYSQNKSVPFWLQVLVGPTDRNYYLYNNINRYFIGGFNTDNAENNDVDLGGGWYGRGGVCWNNYNGNDKILMVGQFAIWYEPWDLNNSNQNQAQFQNYSWGGNMTVNNGQDYVYVNCAVHFSQTTQVDSTYASSLRSAIYDAVKTGFIYPTLEAGETYTSSIIDNDRFRIATQTGNVIDITSSGTPNLKFELVSQEFGSLDGAYIIDTVPSDTTMTIKLPFQTENKTLSIDASTDIDTASDLINVPGHNLASGSSVTYNNEGTTNIQNLVSGSLYYVYAKDNDYIGLATSYSNAINRNLIDINTVTPVSSGATYNLTTDYSSSSWFYNTVLVQGAFSTAFEAAVTALQIGDTITYGTTALTLVTTPASNGSGAYYFSVVESTSFQQLDASTITTGEVTPVQQSFVAGVVNGLVKGPGLVSLAIASNKVVGDADTLFKRFFKAGDIVYLKDNNQTPGDFISAVIKAVPDDATMLLNTVIPVAATNTNYFISTAMAVRPDGTTQHRPFDGGVEIQAGTAPNSQIIRQTRKYFRYQSGKGIQCSLAINFDVPIQLETLSGINGDTGYATTKYPHGLAVGNLITVEGSTDPSYNGRVLVDEIIDDFTFTYPLEGPLNESVPNGLITYSVSAWTNSFVRGGLFDEQNGFFFEYDGSQLYCVRRSSTQQLPGTANVITNSNLVTGTNTNWSGQLEAGDKVVIRGMSYRVIKIRSKTEMVVQPQYRGTSSTGVVITKTIDTRVPQSQWSLDVCDGTGYTGYILDTTKIQMCYMDYSWYGAGKIRFGFKTEYGHVQYVHDFVHNNRLTEAYMRSGNICARYEIENKTQATYIPSLFHWGTSVIMDGRFDDDKAYLFTANSNTLIYTNGQNSTATITSASALISEYNYNKRNYDWYVTFPVSNENAFKFTVGTPLYSSETSLGGGYGSGGGSGQLVNFDGETVDSAYYQYINGNYQYVVRVYVTTSFNQPSAGQFPKVGNNATIGIGSPITGSADTGTILRNLIPLISIRLAPSVDNGLTGDLGQRDIINRMQLQLKELGLVTTHDCEISLILNGSPSTIDYEKVQSPSLSNLLKHKSGDTITNGTTIFQLRASGGSVQTTSVYNQQTGQTTQVAKRLSNTANFDLTRITDLGNSILGGDGIYPNGPDILTVAVKVINVSEISATSPFAISSRITWTESQA